MYRVKIVGNYYKEEPYLNGYFKKMADEKGGWKDIQLVDEDEDFSVVINWVDWDKENIEPKRTIVIQMEPKYSISQFPGIFSNVEAHRDKILFYHYKNPVEWWISPTYSDLTQGKVSLKKTKKLSTVMSGERWLPGHNQRLELLCHICENIEMDVWGRGHANVWIPEHWPSAGKEMGPLPWRTKDQGLFPYKYTYSAENTAEKNYFTEKIVDAILSECLCFYWGCPNLYEFIDPRAYIPITVHDKQHSLSLIKSAIKNNEWERRLPYIKAAKKKILNELQFFPTLSTIINKKINKSNNKIISFSLYGSDTLYTDGAVRCVKYGRDKYPDWEWRFYIGDSVPRHVCDSLEEMGCNLIYMKGEPENNLSMFWRFYAAKDSNIVIFRDADSVILWREVHAVNEWLQSKKSLHCMRDHYWHDIPILGGMWGIKGGIPNVVEMIASFNKEDRKGVDQKWLTEFIWPIYKDESLSHVGHENGILYGDYEKRNPEITSRIKNNEKIDGAIQLDFPTLRKNNEHVGQVNPPCSHNTDY